jgi:hypothetical protein
MITIRGGHPQITTANRNKAKHLIIEAMRLSSVTAPFYIVAPNGRSRTPVWGRPSILETHHPSQEISNLPGFPLLREIRGGGSYIAYETKHLLC